MALIEFTQALKFIDCTESITEKVKKLVFTDSNIEYLHFENNNLRIIIENKFSDSYCKIDFELENAQIQSVDLISNIHKQASISDVFVEKQQNGKIAFYIQSNHSPKYNCNESDLCVCCDKIKVLSINSK